MKQKILDIQNLLWLALFLALAGSLKHLAAIFATIDGNHLLGWLQAIAIDVGLFALAYSIRVRKAAGRNIKPVWAGVVVFTAISVYGNLAYGLFATTGNLPAWIVASRPVVLAASLPILVLFLSELLSDDEQYRQLAKMEQTEIEEAAEVTEIKTELATIATKEKRSATNKRKPATKAARKNKLTAIYQENPAATVTELATELDVSRATIRNYASELGLELATNGKNGNG